MDSDIKYIIEEEGRLVKMLEDSKQAARERVEARRVKLAEFREAELKRVGLEYSRMTEEKRQEIKCKMDNDVKGARAAQERLFDDAELKNKITGRIVSVILENRT